MIPGFSQICLGVSAVKSFLVVFLSTLGSGGVCSNGGGCRKCFSLGQCFRLLFISLGALLAFSLPSFAYSEKLSGSTESLLKLHQFQLAAQRSLGSFYMYSYLEGDQRYARITEESLQDGHALLLQITKLPSEVSSALLGKLEQQWNGYQSELKKMAATIESRGFIDVQRVIDLATQSDQLMALSSTLYAKIQQESGSEVAPLTQLSREQSLLIQSIAIDYVERSGWVDGVILLGNNGNGGKRVDEMADKFARSLDKFYGASKNTVEITRLLIVIRSKWRYIESSLKNYDNEKNVPVVVDRVANGISKDFESVSAEYAKINL